MAAGPVRPFPVIGYRGDHAQTLPLRTAADVVLVRHEVRRMAVASGFDLVSQTKLVTAASELARNTVIHGGGGDAVADIVQDSGRTGIRLVFTDAGPGIADAEQAMTGGWSSADGLGLGLPGSKRLVDEFELDSGPGRGTRVSVLMWQRER